MKTKFRYRILLMGLLVSLGTMSMLSCSGDGKYDFPGDSGKVYVQVRSSNMVNSTTNVIETTISNTTLGVFGEAKISFPIQSTIPVKNSVIASFDIDNSLVETYNATNGTKYLPIDPSYLTFIKKDLAIGNGKMISEEMVEIFIDPSKISDLKLGQYLVPIKMISVKGGLEISSNLNTVYMHVIVNNDPGDIPVADRTGWTIADISSEEIEEEDTPGMKVLDGDRNTIWHSEWSKNCPPPPHHITIDMNKNVSLAGIQYVVRNTGSGAPQGLIVEVSENNFEWTKVATFENSELPIERGAEFKTIFTKLYRVRYFRLTITKVIGDADYTSLAEINAYIVQ